MVVIESPNAIASICRQSKARKCRFLSELRVSSCGVCHFVTKSTSPDDATSPTWACGSPSRSDLIELVGPRVSLGPGLVRPIIWAASECVCSAWRMIISPRRRSRRRLLCSGTVGWRSNGEEARKLARELAIAAIASGGSVRITNRAVRKLIGDGSNCWPPISSCWIPFPLAIVACGPHNSRSRAARSRRIHTGRDILARRLLHFKPG